MRTILRRATLSLVALVLFAFPALAQTIQGKVVGVSDGDTVKVVTPDKQLYKIRLNGVDCPESNQAFGQKAKQFTSQFAFSKQATVDVTDVDRYGRSVGRVRVGGKDLNQALVKEGLAWWYRQYAPNDLTLKQLEAEARRAKRNLWSDPAPTPPWDFRHGKTTAFGGSASRATSRPRVEKPVYRAEIATIVYGTNTGHKYHLDGCQYLRRSQIPMTVKEAETRGLTPCSKCF